MLIVVPWLYQTVSMQDGAAAFQVRVRVARPVCLLIISGHCDCCITVLNTDKRSLLFFSASIYDKVSSVISNVYMSVASTLSVLVKYEETVVGKAAVRHHSYH